MTINPTLEQVLKILDSKRPLDPYTAASLKEHFYLKYNQQSNAIEGNSLTLTETKVLLENGVTANGKPFKDHVDILNHRGAIDYLDHLVATQAPLSESVIKEFHYLLIKGTDLNHYAGRYRTTAVVLQGSEHMPPQPYLVNPQMERLVSEYNENLSKTDNKLALIARLHSNFVHIHPFIDGNGRTGRLLMNLELMKYGYPLAILNVARRNEYYNCLRKADLGDYSAIEAFVAEAVKETAIEILSVVDPDWEQLL